jgi:GT2 family glycosyltransferase
MTSLDPTRGTQPLLSGVVVHWRDEEHLRELAARWPLGDSRFELTVVDNSDSAPNLPAPIRLLSPATNLGFAGGANAGARASRGDLLLFLNPDAIPDAGALESILDGFARYPEAAGLAPRLVSPSGERQWRWQLRRLPRWADFLRQALASGASLGLAGEPAAGTAIEQPAAAAWALRRAAFDSVRGFDEGFHPAWMEDVDLAKRLAAVGACTVYWPAASFVHALGSTVSRLGYGPFLEILDRNTLRYVRRHHGGTASAILALALAAGTLARLAASFFVVPRRAADHRDAVRSQAARLLHLPRAWRSAIGDRRGGLTQ